MNPVSKFGDNGVIRKLEIHMKKSVDICDVTSSSIENQLKSVRLRERKVKKNSLSSQPRIERDTKQ